MRLTSDHVALSLRPEPDLGPDPTRPQHTEEELDDIAGRFDAECGGDPFWVFAYGSLIWKPGFESIEHRRATAHGWHRAFCLKMIRFRGTPDKPGLMLALARGGRCHGMRGISLQDRQAPRRVRHPRPQSVAAAGAGGAGD
jgi:cation transport protein ChaC